MVVQSPNYYGTADKTGGEWGREIRIHRYMYSFVQSMTWLALLRPLSIEPNVALARGYVLELNPKEVVLSIDHGKGACAADDDDDSEPVFRIDRRTLR